jgi:hypothetical protein
MKVLTYRVFFNVGSATTTYRMQDPNDIMLVVMCGDLPEDFQDMCDRRKCYNRPLMMKRSEMGKSVYVESKRKGRTYQGASKGGVA